MSDYLLKLAEELAAKGNKQAQKQVIEHYYQMFADHKALNDDKKVYW